MVSTQQHEAAESQEKRISLGWDAFVLLLFCDLVILLRWRAIGYLSGLNPAVDTHMPFGSLLLYLLAFAMLLLCVVAMVWRLGYLWRRCPTWVGCVRCFVVLLMCAAMTAAVSPRVRSVDRFAQGFEERMRRDADVGAIRAWFNGQTGRTPDADVPSSHWPPCIADLSPAIVHYTEDAASVKLTWASGFLPAHSLVVGPADMELPSTTAYDLVIPLEAGAYLRFQNK